MLTKPVRRQPLRVMAMIKVATAVMTRTVVAPLASGDKSIPSSMSSLRNNAIKIRRDPNQVSPQAGIPLMSAIAPPADIVTAIHTHAAMLTTS